MQEITSQMISLSTVLAFCLSELYINPSFDPVTASSIKQHFNTCCMPKEPKMRSITFPAPLLLLLILLANYSNVSEARPTKLGACRPSGTITGKTPPPGQCNQENDSDCCKAGEKYKTYKCSPSITSETRATLTINSFEKGGDGGGPSECDDNYHSNSIPIVALSTGWYDGGSRCFNNITVTYNGRSVQAKVVDECDSTMGCDDDHDYQPPCPNNIVDGSKAVWEALGISDPDDVGSIEITWSED